MRIIVFSDTHGNYAAAQKIFKRNGNADLFIFLGDGMAEFNRLKAHYIDYKTISVKGNCDFMPGMAEHAVYDIPGPGDRKIFLTHGDRWGVRVSPTMLHNKAREEGCCIALFGHTHIRHAEWRNGILLLNPGSAGQPRDGKPACYAWIDVTPMGIVYNHVDL